MADQELKDRKTAVVGTPEGDNEYPPDQPLGKLPDEALQEPRGGAVDGYRQPEHEV